jgi:hypothetical protein
MDKGDSIMLGKVKNWLKMRIHSCHQKNGMLIALAVIIVLVIGPFVWKAIQGGYDTILARFTKASSNADVNSWNK